MKAIKIKEENRNKIQAVIDEVQGKSTTRTISANSVFRMVDIIEEMFDIPKVHLTGLVVDVDINREKLPSAYKFTPKSTQVRIERRKTGWFLTKVERKWMTQVLTYFHVQTMPEDTKKALIWRYMRW